MKFTTLATFITCTVAGVDAQSGSFPTLPIPSESLTAVSPAPSSTSISGGDSSITISIITEPDLSVSGSSVSTIQSSVTRPTSANQSSVTRPTSANQSSGTRSSTSPAPSASETEDPGSALSVSIGFRGVALGLVGGLVGALF